LSATVNELATSFMSDLVSKRGFKHVEVEHKASRFEVSEAASANWVSAKAEIAQRHEIEEVPNVLPKPASKTACTFALEIKAGKFFYGIGREEKALFCYDRKLAQKMSLEDAKRAQLMLARAFSVEATLITGGLA
jgi:hypothetical protein